MKPAFAKAENGLRSEGAAPKRVDSFFLCLCALKGWVIRWSSRSSIYILGSDICIQSNDTLNKLTMDGLNVM